MSDEKLEEYLKVVEPSFDSHIEKGTIEMNNEYYNLLEERMARLINKNEQLQQENQKLKNKINRWVDFANVVKNDEKELIKNKHILNELESWLEEKRDNANQECLDNISQNTADKVISYNIALTIKHDIEKVLDKLKELKNNE